MKIALVYHSLSLYAIDMTNTQEPPAATAQDTVTKDVLVNVVLDRSGSMNSCRKGTISGYNEYLQGLRADKESNYSVSLIQFDSPNDGPELTVTYADKPLSEITNLSAKEYEPRGMTPLYDAIGECIRRVEAKKRAVITVIITDGHENASREFDREAIKKLIGGKEAEGWKFVFLGANIDSAAVGGSIGVAVADCANYAAGNERAVFAAMTGSTYRYSSAVRSHGLFSTEARMASNLTGDERSAMMGGRPAAPPPFRTKEPDTATIIKGRTKWAVRNKVHGS